MVGTPAGLYYLFAILMLVLAAYALAFVVGSSLEHWTVGRDVEVSHLAMGVAMAGMFVPAWSFGPKLLWELIFGALLVWFVVRALRSIRTWGLHVPHTAIHAVMSLTMLLMYWFPRGTLSHSMSMGAAVAGPRMDPGLSFLLAFVLFGSAVFTIASPNRGATHFGTHCDDRLRVPLASALLVEPPFADAPVADGQVGTVQLVQTPPAPTGVLRTIATPTLLDASHVVMSIGMGLMLILMI
jgi:hypothetical protein